MNDCKEHISGWEAWNFANFNMLLIFEVIIYIYTCVNIYTYKYIHAYVYINPYPHIYERDSDHLSYQWYCSDLRSGHRSFSDRKLAFIIYNLNYLRKYTRFSWRCLGPPMIVSFWFQSYCLETNPTLNPHLSCYLPITCYGFCFVK